LNGIVRLAVPNSELEAMYERATAILREINVDDGWLFWFAVYVKPYHDPPNEVLMTLQFHSERSQRDYSFWLSDNGRFSEDRSGWRTLEREPSFTDRPWREQPEWCGIFNVAAKTAGPLVRDSDAELAIKIGAWAPSEWSVEVKDYGGGRSLSFMGRSPDHVRLELPVGM
jgi:hypothetical protein